MVFRSLMTAPAFARYNSDPFVVVQRALRSLDDSYVSACATSTAGLLSVRLDVKEDKEAFHVTADLPGLSEKDVEVTFDDGLLTIKGEKKSGREETKDTWHIAERSYGSFERQLTLSTAIDAAKIEAKFDKGVLSIVLPKAPPEPSTSKKIDIKMH